MVGSYLSTHKRSSARSRCLGTSSRSEQAHAPLSSTGSAVTFSNAFAFPFPLFAAGGFAAEEKDGCMLVRSNLGGRDICALRWSFPLDARPRKMLRTGVTAFVFCFLAGGGRSGASAVRLRVLRSVDCGLERFFVLWDIETAKDSKQIW